MAWGLFGMVRGDLGLEGVGCGSRNGGARAVYVNDVVADDVHRVHEQIHSDTHEPVELKHRQSGPLARRVLCGTAGAPRWASAGPEDSGGVVDRRPSHARSRGARRAPTCAGADPPADRWWLKPVWE